MQPIVKTIFRTPENDVYAAVQISDTQAEIYCNNTLAYGMLTLQEAQDYMKRLKILSSKKQEPKTEKIVKVCTCKCHQKVEQDFDALPHCSFCSSGRFTKEKK